MEKDRERLAHHERETRKQADKLEMNLQQKYEAEQKHKKAKKELKNLDEKILSKTNGIFYYLKLLKFTYAKIKGVG